MYIFKKLVTHINIISKNLYLYFKIFNKNYKPTYNLHNDVLFVIIIIINIYFYYILINSFNVFAIVDIYIFYNI